MHLFKASFGPFVQPLNEQNLTYRMREVRPGLVMASGGTLDLVQAAGNAAFWASLATVVIAFITDVEVAR